MTLVHKLWLLLLPVLLPQLLIAVSEAATAPTTPVVDDHHVVGVTSQRVWAEAPSLWHSTSRVTTAVSVFNGTLLALSGPSAKHHDTGFLWLGSGGAPLQHALLPLPHKRGGLRPRLLAASKPSAKVSLLAFAMNSGNAVSWCSVSERRVACEYPAPLPQRMRLADTDAATSLHARGGVFGFVTVAADSSRCPIIVLSNGTSSTLGRDAPCGVVSNVAVAADPATGEAVELAYVSEHKAADKSRIWKLTRVLRLYARQPLLESRPVAAGSVGSGTRTPFLAYHGSGATVMLWMLNSVGDLSRGDVSHALVAFNTTAGQPGIHNVLHAPPPPVPLPRPSGSAAMTRTVVLAPVSLWALGAGDASGVCRFDLNTHTWSYLPADRYGDAGPARFLAPLLADAVDVAMLPRPGGNAGNINIALLGTRRHNLFESAVNSVHRLRHHHMPQLLVQRVLQRHAGVYDDEAAVVAGAGDTTATAMLTAALAYSYAEDGCGSTRDLAWQMFHALRNMTLVTGETGLLAASMKHAQPHGRWRASPTMPGTVWLGSTSGTDVVSYVWALQLTHRFIAETDAERSLVSACIANLVRRILQGGLALRHSDSSLTSASADWSAAAFSPDAGLAAAHRWTSAPIEILSLLTVGSRHAPGAESKAMLDRVFKLIDHDRYLVDHLGDALYVTDRSGTHDLSQALALDAWAMQPEHRMSDIRPEDARTVRAWLRSDAFANGTAAQNAWPHIVATQRWTKDAVDAAMIAAWLRDYPADNTAWRIDARRADVRTAQAADTFFRDPASVLPVYARALPSLQASAFALQRPVGVSAESQAAMADVDVVDFLVTYFAARYHGLISYPSAGVLCL